MKFIRKLFLAVILLLGLTTLFMIAVPLFFKEKLADGVKSVANSRLKSELDFSGMDVSFFNHFPRLTIGLHDFLLKGSVPFDRDTLISAKEASFGVDLFSLFGKAIEINRVYLDRACIHVKYNENGDANFDVYQSPDSIPAKTDAPTGDSVNINIEQIHFSDCRFSYSDPSIPVKLDLKGFNYKGKSKINGDLLSLTSQITVDSLDFLLNNRYYLRSKPVEAKLTTKVNLTDLTLFFEKNDLKIQDMPVNFNGRFNFQKNGYQLTLRLLSIYEKEVFSAALRLTSTEKLHLFIRVNTVLDLAKWSKALGVSWVDLRGLINFNLNAEGIYETGQNPHSLQPDTVLLSIPRFTVSSNLTNGYLKYRDLPEALTDMTFDLNAGVTDNNYRHIYVKLEKFKAHFLSNNLEGFFHLDGLDDFPLEARVITRCDLARLKQVIPIDSLDLSGMLDIDLDIRGKFSPEKKYFPVSKVGLVLTNGSIRTKYYPRPIEHIELKASVTNGTGQLKDTRVVLSPLSFNFEGNPFEIKADIAHPGNVVYDITSQGVVDVARIYKLFSRKGMELDGSIETHVSLKGRQSDAMAGHYDRLHNKGRFILRNIGFVSEYLPLKIILKEGVFRFDNDNLWFEKFLAFYGASDIRLDGYVSNVVNYVLADHQKLKGSFHFGSKYLLADQFMSPIKEAEVGKAASENPLPEGVIVIPENLAIGITADLKKIRFQDMNIHDLSAKAEIRDGMALLKGMQFTLIGAPMAMDASYGSINRTRAFFDFHISAKDFDIQRAYNEIALFRDLASSAAHVEGIVSLDYSLKGKLRSGMAPVFPSLDGSGTLTLSKVKVKGLKLLTVVGKSTGKEKLSNPDLSKVDLTTTIRNNVITLDQTKMKISGFRLKVSGTTNFNGELSLKMRIGLPPLGIIGIPLRVLGTADDPKLKYGRGNSDDPAKETEYTDEMPEEMKEKLRNAKEDDL